MTAPSHWQCPDCGRSFAHENQYHSCHISPLDKHFEGKSVAVRELFDTLTTKLKPKLNFHLTPLKTAVYFTTTTHFLAVFVRKNYLILEFISDIPFMDERIHRTEKASNSLYSHFLRISHENEIDSQLIHWIISAYKLVS